MKLKTIFILYLSLVPIKAYTQPNHEVKNNKAEYNSLIVLRSYGLYNTYDTSLMPCGERINIHFNTYSPLFILNENKAVYIHKTGDKGTVFTSDKYFQKLQSDQSIQGTYSVENKKIKASLPINLFVWGMRIKTFTTHFEGEVINRDTIINWRMVPPYPKAPKKFNADFEDLLTPKLLYFIESKELSGLDSLYKQELSKGTK